MSLAAVRTLELSKLERLRDQIRARVVEKKNVSIYQLLNGEGIDFFYAGGNTHPNALVIDAVANDHALAINLAENLASFLGSFNVNGNNEIQVDKAEPHKETICRAFALAARLPAAESLCSVLCWWAKYFIKQSKSGEQIINCNLAVMSALLRQQEKGDFNKCLAIWKGHLSIDNREWSLVFQEILISAWRGILWLCYVNQEVKDNQKVEYISNAFSVLNKRSRLAGDKREKFLYFASAAISGILGPQTDGEKFSSSSFIQKLIDDIMHKNSDPEALLAIQDFFTDYLSERHVSVAKSVDYFISDCWYGMQLKEVIASDNNVAIKPMLSRLNSSGDMLYL